MKLCGRDFFFFQAEDGIRDLVRSRGLGDVYKRQTPTCTIEACNLRDNYHLLKKNGFEVVGISPNDEKSHKKFETKFNLPFTLIADTSHSIINKYGVWGPKQLYGRKYDCLHRTSFLIDEKGIIRHIFLKPRNKEHAQEIIKKWNEINK